MSDPMTNIEELKQRFLDGGSEEDMETIKTWEGQLKRATMTTRLMKNDAMKLLLDEVDRRISTCNKLLLSDRAMTEKERDKVFERLDCYTWLKNLFAAAEATVKTVAAKVQDELT